GAENLFRQQVVDQAEGVLDVAAGKFGLVLNHFAALLQQPPPGFPDIPHRDFQDWSQGWSPLNEQVDLLPVKANQIGRLASDFKSEMPYIEARRLLKVRCLNQNIRAKTIRHKNAS